MRSFPKPTKGGSLLDWATAAWEQMRRNQIKAGPGILARQTSDGMVISAATREIRRIPARPLYIVTTRPAYIVAPLSPPAEGTSRLWVTWGSINNAVATNWDDYFDLTANALVWADITLNTASTSEIITSWEIATGASLPAQPAWPPSGPGEPLRPTKLYILLGNYVHATASAMNNGSGSLLVGEYVTGIYDEYSTLGAVLTKALTWSRVNY